MPPHIANFIFSVAAAIIATALLLVAFFSGNPAHELPVHTIVVSAAVVALSVDFIIYRACAATRRRGAHLAPVIFLTTLAIIPLMIITATNYTAEISEDENKVLTKLPTVFVTHERFPKQMDAYIEDRIGFKYKMIEFTRKVPFLTPATLDKSGNVIIGKDGWLFYNDHKFTETSHDFQRINSFSEKELESIAAHFYAADKWTKENNIQLVILIGPNKHNVYPEYYSSLYNQLDKPSKYKQVMEYISNRDNNSLEIVDALNILQNAKSTGQLYYKQDTHWNTKAGYHIYLGIMEIIKKYFPDAKVIAEHDFEYNDTGIRTSDLVPALKGVLVQKLDNEIIPVFSDNVSVNVISEVEGASTTVLDRVVTTNVNGPRIFMINDSFATAPTVYLEHSVSTITNYVGYSQSPLKYKKEILDFKADILLWEIQERFLRGLSKTSIKD